MAAIIITLLLIISCRQVRSGRVPGFKPIGGESSPSAECIPTSTFITGIKRSASATGQGMTSSSDKSSEKKSKLAKFGLKFQSAGTLMSIGEQIGKDTPVVKDVKTTPILSQVASTSGSGGVSGDGSGGGGGVSGGGVSGGGVSGGGVSGGGVSGVVSSKVIAKYTTAKWDKEGDFEKRAQQAKEMEHASRVEKAPPPLKSRQRELIMENYHSNSDDEEEEMGLTAKNIIRKKSTKFKFSFAK